MRRTSLLLTGTLVASLAGCPNQVTQTPGPGPIDLSQLQGLVTDLALNFNGNLSGLIDLVSSTGGLVGQQASRKLAQQAQSRQMVIWLEDLQGNRLRDASGAVYPEVTVSGAGFRLEGLPVGVDIVVVCDVNGDGVADMRTVINIPAQADGNTGSLDGAEIDPLSTLCAARLMEMLQQAGVDPEHIGVSPSGLIARIRAAYEHLYEEAGIDEAITIDDILGRVVAQLFEQLLPETAQRSMHMFSGNLRMAVAQSTEDVVRAAAEVLVRGGFMVADDPEGIDLSFLGSLPGVQTLSFSDLMSLTGSVASPPAEGQTAPPPGPSRPEPKIYRSTVAPVDRNYVHHEGGPRPPAGPIFSEHILVRMAEAYRAGRTISLRDLYRLVVDIDRGLAARLMYGYPGVPGQPPRMVFESADGGGVEVDLAQFFQAVHDLGLDRPDPQTFAQRQTQLRALIRQYLGNTAEPPFERLFQGILYDRLGSLDELARSIRELRAHLPFSLSGPSQFFVLATADSFRNSGAAAVTVNLELDRDGKVLHVSYQPAGDGSFYILFGPMTERGMLVSFLNRARGRPLHDKRGGLVQVELGDDAIFNAVGGMRFIDAFSETGVNYPGAPALRVPNPEFNAALPPDPATNPPSFEAFVLVDRPGPDATPVRVRYDAGTVVVDAAGPYYLMFTERTPAEGLFALISADGRLLLSDPADPASRVLVSLAGVQGAPTPQQFRHIFGTHVPNPDFDKSRAPYYDDIDDDGVQDESEPVFDFRPFLGDPADWRSGPLEQLYRRADNHQPPDPREVDFAADTPRMRDGVALVLRNLRPALNAYRFGRPAVTIDLLGAFAPPELFDGTHALNADTRVNPFMALSLLNLVFDSIHNVPAVVDFDGPGPQPPHRELIDAHLFTPPVGDPLQLIAAGFDQLATNP